MMFEQVDTPPRLVQVTWEDAACLDTTHWVNLEDPPAVYTPMLFRTVGYLLMEDKDFVLITASWSPKVIGPREQIPRGMVREMVFLEPVVQAAVRKKVKSK
jgi:hypothetical protein